MDCHQFHGSCRRQRPGGNSANTPPLGLLGLRGMEFAGNLRLNVRLGSFRDRAPSLTNHLNPVRGICQDFTKQEIPPKMSEPFF